MLEKVTAIKMKELYKKKLDDQIKANFSHKASAGSLKRLKKAEDAVRVSSSANVE